MPISYEDFDRVDLRSGVVVKVEDFPRTKKPAYKVWVDFGDKIGIKQTSAQVTKYYTLDTLLGHTVIGCINLESKNIAGFTSEFLLVGFSDSDGNVCLATIDPIVKPGQKMF